MTPEQIDEKKLDNNSRAYEELVYALEKRKMMEGRQLSEEQNDLRGICANGKVYKFETLYHGNPVKTLWTSDCGGSKGSATANANDILLMFLNQIPDGKKIAAGVGLQQEDTFLPREDADVAQSIRSVLENRGVKIITGAQTERIDDANLTYIQDGKK